MFLTTTMRNGKRFRGKSERPSCGDLGFIPDGDGFIAGVMDNETTITFGDVHMTVASNSIFFIQQSKMKPTAGHLIGRRFDSLAAVLAEVRKHRD